MHQSQNSAFKELFTHVVGQMAKSLCERNGETREHQFARSQACIQMIMGFMPRDAIEAMLSGHCVMFHELMVDSALGTLRGELDTTRRATRGGIVAMDRSFRANLSHLERYQTRNAEWRRDLPEEIAEEIAEETREAVGEAAEAATAEAADQAASMSPGTAADDLRPASVPSQEGTDSDAKPAELRATLRFAPSPDVLAACLANPEAMEALEAGDAERFARAMGVEVPNEAFLAAAAQPGSPFDVRGTGEKTSVGAPVRARR